MSTKTLTANFFLVMLKDRNFIYVDAQGLLDALIMGWDDSFEIYNSQFVHIGIIIEGKAKGIQKDFQIVNIYVPYMERMMFWDTLKFVVKLFIYI